jgi:hypothetical protein
LRSLKPDSEYFTFLDELRDSGTVDTVLAASCLVREFPGLRAEEAKARAGRQRRPFLEDIYEILTIFQLVYGEPACPCGYYGGSRAGRTCSAYCVRTYRDRLLDIAKDRLRGFARVSVLKTSSDSYHLSRSGALKQCEELIDCVMSLRCAQPIVAEGERYAAFCARQSDEEGASVFFWLIFERPKRVIL